MEVFIESATMEYGPQVEAARQAAFDAVHHGVSISLLVAGCVIIFSGIVAWATFSPKKMVVEED